MTRCPDMTFAMKPRSLAAGSLMPGCCAKTGPQRIESTALTLAALVRIGRSFHEEATPESSLMPLGERSLLLFRGERERHDRVARAEGAAAAGGDGHELAAARFVGHRRRAGARG